MKRSGIKELVDLSALSRNILELLKESYEPQSPYNQRISQSSLSQPPSKYRLTIRHIVAFHPRLLCAARTSDSRLGKTRVRPALTRCRGIRTLSSQGPNACSGDPGRDGAAGFPRAAVPIRSSRCERGAQGPGYQYFAGYTEQKEWDSPALHLWPAVPSTKKGSRERLACSNRTTRQEI